MILVEISGLRQSMQAAIHVLDVGIAACSIVLVMDRSRWHIDIRCWVSSWAGEHRAFGIAMASRTIHDCIATVVKCDVCVSTSSIARCIELIFGGPLKDFVHFTK